MMSQNLDVYPNLFGSGAVYNIFLSLTGHLCPFTCNEPRFMKGEKVKPGDTDDVSKVELKTSKKVRKNDIRLFI